MFLYLRNLRLTEKTRIFSPKPIWCSFATSTYLHDKRNHSISNAVHMVVKFTAMNWGSRVRSDSFRMTNEVAFDYEFFVKPDRSDISTIFRTELFSVLCEVSWLRTIFYSRILSDTLVKNLLVWLLCSSQWPSLRYYSINLCESLGCLCVSLRNKNCWVCNAVISPSSKWQTS